MKGAGETWRILRFALRPAKREAKAGRLQTSIGEDSAGFAFFGLRRFRSE
jgi:hypothetical protein